MASTGKIVRWNPDRGFGFVRLEDGREAFLHVTDIEPRQPRGVDLRGQEVEVHRVSEGQKGPRVGSATLGQRPALATPPDAVAVEATVLMGGTGKWVATIRPASFLEGDPLFEGFAIPREIRVASGVDKARDATAGRKADQITRRDWLRHPWYLAGRLGGGSGARTEILITPDEVRSLVAEVILRKHRGRQPYRYDEKHPAWAARMKELEQHFAALPNPEGFYAR